MRHCVRRSDGAPRFPSRFCQDRGAEFFSRQRNTPLRNTTEENTMAKIIKARHRRPVEKTVTPPKKRDERPQAEPARAGRDN
ncbi:hypothetical protein JCM9957A_04000 [Kineosporia succinea]